MLLAHRDIERTAQEVAARNLGAQVVTRVLSEDAVDLDGQDALRLTIVLTPGSVPGIDRHAILDTLVQIHDRLQEAGDVRFPILDYATEDELADSGEPES
jgi:hypothetical protein